MGRRRLSHPDADRVQDRCVKANLATASIRCKKVHQFHASLKYFSGRRLLDESRTFAMDRHASNTFDRAALLYEFRFMADSNYERAAWKNYESVRFWGENSAPTRISYLKSGMKSVLDGH